MNVELMIVGILLFGGMTAGGVNLYLQRRKARILDDIINDTQNQAEDAQNANQNS